MSVFICQMLGKDSVGLVAYFDSWWRIKKKVGDSYKLHAPEPVIMNRKLCLVL